MVDLRGAEESLRQQVAAGGIQQWQMDAELNRLRKDAANSGIADGPRTMEASQGRQGQIDAARASLAQQVASGGIQQWQMDAELNRLEGLASNSGAADTELANIDQSRRDLQQQVRLGHINQDQANAELQRLEALQPVDLNSAQNNLQQQVASGGISQEQADAELARLRQANPTATPAAPRTPVGDAPIENANDAINRQADANRYSGEEQARFNRVDEVSDYGSARYTQNADGSYTRNYSLSGSQQNQLDNQQQRNAQIDQGLGGQLHQVMESYSQPMNFNNAPNAPRASFGGIDQQQRLNLSGMPQANAPRNFDQYGKLPSSEDSLKMRERLEKEQYDKFARDAEPRFRRERQEFDQRMADKGIPAGSRQWRLEEQQLNKNQERARLEAKTAASQFGGQEFSRQFGADMAARGQGVNESGQLYDMASSNRNQVTGERTLARNASVQDRQIGTGERMDLFDLGGRERDRYTSELSFLRDRPLQEYGSLASLQSGIKDPSFSGISGINLNPYDVVGTSLGYDQLNQNAEQAQLQRDFQREMSQPRGGGGGGGGGGGYSPEQIGAISADINQTARRTGRYAPQSMPPAPGSTIF